MTDRGIASAVTAEFDQWARRGDDRGMEISHGRFARPFLDEWGISAADRVLDLGCGNGWALRYMLQQGAVHGVGVELSEQMLRRCSPAAYFLRSPVDRLPFRDGCFSRLLSIECLYYTPDPERALREWARVACAGARLAVLIDLYAENPCAEIWRQAFPFPVHVLPEAEWAVMAAAAGWCRVLTHRISGSPVPEAEFEPDEWAPSYELYREFKEAGTLVIEAQR